MKVFRVWRYVLAPTDEQAAQMRQCAGVVRLVYNLALEQRRARRLSHTPAPQSELGDDPSPENRPGPLRWTRDIAGTVKNVTVTSDPLGWHVSIGCDEPDLF